MQARAERRLQRSLNKDERERLNLLRLEQRDFLLKRAALSGEVPCVVAFAYDGQLNKAMRSIQKECFPKAAWRTHCSMYAPRWPQYIR